MTVQSQRAATARGMSAGDAGQRSASPARVAVGGARRQGGATTRGQRADGARRRSGLAMRGSLIVPAVLAGAAIGHATGGAAPAGGPAVVAVEARGAQTATGFVVAPGRVVTVAHPLDGRLTVRGGDGVPRTAVVLRRDERLDLALLAVLGVRPGGRLAARATHVVVWRGGVQRAAPAIVRRRLDARVRAGDGRLIARRPAIELRADIRAGDSGAPLVQDGRIAGIVFARSRRHPGVAYAVDASALAALLR